MKRRTGILNRVSRVKVQKTLQMRIIGHRSIEYISEKVNLSPSNVRAIIHQFN